MRLFRRDPAGAAGVPGGDGALGCGDGRRLCWLLAAPGNGRGRRHGGKPRADGCRDQRSRIRRVCRTGQRPDRFRSPRPAEPLMTTKFLLPETELPTHWYNVVADLPNPPPPPLGPDGKPVGLDALAAIFPAPLIEQEVSRRALDPDPGAGARDLPALAPDAAPPRPPAREGARHAGAHLLQERVGEPRGLPQAEHVDPAGLLQQDLGHPPPHHRDRRRPVGLLARPRRPAARAWRCGSTW